MRNGRGLGEAREGSLDCNPKCFLYMRKGDDRCGLLFGLGIEPLFMEAASANVFFEAVALICPSSKVQDF